MTTVLFVHGAWQSAACWSEVISRIDTPATRCAAITLTGLGADSRSLSRDVGLSTHIEDVIRAVDEAGTPCVLVGHSYAGMVVTGACEERPSQVRGVVYVDAFVPEAGQSALELLPAPVAQTFQSMADAQGDGWRLPSGDFLLDIWGVRDTTHRAVVRQDLSDFSLVCFRQILDLPDDHARKKPRGYIAAGLRHDYPARAVFEPFVDEARREGWLLAQVDAGHACEIEKPAEVALAISEFMNMLTEQKP